MNADLRLPPYSIEAEQSVLGGLLLDNRAYYRIADGLNGDDFYRAEHRIIFACVAGLIQSDRPADAITTAEALEAAGDIERTGGLAYLGELASNTPSAANVGSYARIIREKAMQRALLSAAAEIETIARGAAPAAEAIAEAAGIVSKLADTGSPASQPKPIASALERALSEIDAAFNGGASIGLQTGFGDLDKRLGGLRAGDMVILAGRPGSGKTTLALNAAENVAIEGGTVFFASLEMGDTQLATRSISRLGRIDLNLLRSGKLDEDDFSRISVAVSKLHKTKLFIDESSALTVAQIEARARRTKLREGALNLIVVDYLGLIRPPVSRTASNRNDEISQISAGLKSMAKRLGCPVIALAQLNRGVESRTDKRPMMSDLRDSGSIEQDADVILMMYRDEYYDVNSPARGYAECIVSKHRNGEPGTVHLGFSGKHCSFFDVDQATACGLAQAQPDKPFRRRFN